MNDHSPFDHVPDPVLGAALREVLDITDDDAFTQRVLERTGVPEAWWEVLGGWARPGLAAALLLVAVGGFLLGRAVQPFGSDVAQEPNVVGLPSVEVSALFGEMAPPDIEAVLTEGNGR